ncbi:mitochondrial K+-H+ exchange-related-domain-containing protein [Bisporella sp. PMI_857]|nr:mitochondrial K+-H+ exchange-related-domain-containing protein [Bisporella sp. PMI_857]
MRLFLLPISTRRTLIYSQRLKRSTVEQNSLLEKGTKKAADIWADWEKKESGWQRKVVDYGNQALRRIPFEEWGLKSIPPLSNRRKEDELARKEEVEVSYPSTLIPKERVLDVLKALGTERQALHRKRLIWSIVGMPLVAPFALVPVIPNLPFFYLVFRAWSHWRALSGSKHLEFLVEKKLVDIQASPILDKLYSNEKKSFESTSSTSGQLSSDISGIESMVLTKAQGKRLAETLDIPELYLELERAVWQVEGRLRAEKEKAKQDSESKQKDK